MDKRYVVAILDGPAMGFVVDALWIEHQRGFTIDGTVYTISRFYYRNAVYLIASIERDLKFEDERLIAAVNRVLDRFIAFHIPPLQELSCQPRP